MSIDALHVSLPDVALLARVQRPPVSMWRRRFAGSSTPFPAPVRMRGAQPFLGVHAVVDWLETTGADEPRTLVADLADAVLDDSAIAELGIDLMAGLRDALPWQAHTARFARAVRTRTLLARLDDLVEPRPTARHAEPAQLAERIDAHVAGAAAGTFDLRRKDPCARTDQHRRRGALDDEGTQGHPLEGR